MYDIESFYGPNAGYVLDLYERYLQNPSSIDRETRAVFDSWLQDSHNGHASTEARPRTVDSTASYSSPLQQTTLEGDVPQSSNEVVAPQVSQIVAASALAHAIRERGHLGARLDPLGSEPLGDPAPTSRDTRVDG